jgi:hypothetical protein
VIVKNNSAIKIDSLLFKNSSGCFPLKFTNIGSNTSQIKKFLNCNEPSLEGNVIITIYIGNKVESIGHGYYTAGGTFFKKISITVDKNEKLSIIEKH